VKSKNGCRSAPGLLAQLAESSDGEETVRHPNARALLVQKIVLDNEPRYAAEGLKHVGAPDLQEALVGVIAANEAHREAVESLAHVGLPPLRQKLIAVVTEAQDGSASALAAFWSERLSIDPMEKDRLLHGIRDPKIILEALRHVNTTERRVLVESLVAADEITPVEKALRDVPERDLRILLIGILAKHHAHHEAAEIVRYEKDPEVLQLLITTIAEAEQGSPSAASILWEIKDPNQRLQLIRSISTPGSAVSALGWARDATERQILVDEIVKADDPGVARGALRYLGKHPDFHEPLVALIARHQAYHEASEALSDVQDPTLRQQLVTCVASAKRVGHSSLDALVRIKEPSQRLELLQGITEPAWAVAALKYVQEREERAVLVRTIANGRRGTAIDAALTIVAGNSDFVAELEKERRPYGDQIAVLTEELIADDTDLEGMKEITRELYTIFCAIAAEGRDPRGPTQYTEYGTALDPELAARCVLDTHRIRAFLKGGKLAIEAALERFPHEEVIVFDPTAGPFGALNVPLALLFKGKRVRFLATDIIPENVVYHQRVVRELGLEDQYVAIREADAVKCNLRELVPDGKAPQVVIVEAMMEALTQEPQVAIMTNLVGQVHPEAIWVPHDVEIYLEMQSAKPEGFLNPPPRRIIRRETVTTLRRILERTAGDVKKCVGLMIQGVFDVPLDSDQTPEVHLATEVTTFPGVILSAGLSDISGRILLERGVRGLASLTFEYPVGRGKESLSVTRVSPDGTEATRHPWSKGNSMMGWGGGGVYYEFNEHRN